MQDIQINIINILGKEIYFKKLKQFKGIYNDKIDMKAYAKGIYLLKVKTNTTTVNKKIIIE